MLYRERHILGVVRLGQLTIKALASVSLNCCGARHIGGPNLVRLSVWIATMLAKNTELLFISRTGIDLSTSMASPFIFGHAVCRCPVHS